jgi:tRNA pseudouridine32 synthase/23S rRNA pseudouridine746 synthase
VVAHNKKAAAALSQLFAKREVTKTYHAKVEGRLPQPEITIKQPIDGKPAISHVKELSFDGESSLVEVNIETGRKHQIRLHLAGIGCPIIGDRLHGNGGENTPNLQLKAVKIDFKCPISAENKSYSLV